MVQSCRKNRKLIGMLYRNFNQQSSSLHTGKALRITESGLTWNTPVLYGTPISRKTPRQLKMPRYLLLGFALNLGPQTTIHFYFRSIYQPILSDRRETLKLCPLFNILTCTGNTGLFSHRSTPYAIQHLNKVQLTVPQAHSDQYKLSYFPFIIQKWNNLEFDTRGMNSDFIQPFIKNY